MVSGVRVVFFFVKRSNAGSRWFKVFRVWSEGPISARHGGEAGGERDTERKCDINPNK